MSSPKTTVKPGGYQRCTRCVMDTTDREITFNSLGHCNHCTNFLEKLSGLTYHGAESDKALNGYIMKIRKDGQGKRYDCIAGISGGADSCYVALVCKRMGLRPLLVHMDNGWNSELAVKNIEVVCRSLDLDLETYVLNWNEFRDVQLSHLRASVPEIETPTDIAILMFLHRAAVKYNVKHIIMGGNYATEGILPKSWHYDAKDLRYSRAIHKRFGTMKISDYPAFDWRTEAYHKFVRGTRIFYMLNQVPYSKEIAVSALEAIGWRQYEQKHHESLYTRIVQSYILPVKFDIDYRKPTLSTKICTGAVKRADALDELQALPYNETTLATDIQYLCKKLGISVDEFESIMSAPPRTHRDFPNAEKFLAALYQLYRRIRGIPGS